MGARGRGGVGRALVGRCEGVVRALAWADVGRALVGGHGEGCGWGFDL